MSKKLLLIPIIFSLLLLAGCGPEETTTTAEETIVPVKTAVVSQGNLAENYQTIGKVEAIAQASVSAKISGRATGINVELGDYVTKDQILATIEQIDYQNQLSQAQATLTQAEASLTQSQANFARMEKLFAESVVSQQEYDAAKTAYDIAVSQHNQGKIGVSLATEQLKNTTITAPINGYIASRNINQGEMIGSSSPLFTIVDLSQVYVTVNLSDSYIGQTRIGQKAKVTLSSVPGENYTGTVAQIAPAANSSSKTFPVKILLNNTARNFRDGMLANVTLNFNEKNAVLLIPVEAVIDETGNKSVYVVNNGTATRKTITVGISDDKNIEVISGLSADETIVTLGQNNLENGTKVVVK